jgi:Ni,Fe-hydrogenase maturation factor
MEFKGTKVFKVEYLTTMDFPYKYVVNTIQETDEEAEANALLISKAPEMLEMLDYLSTRLGTAFEREIQEINQLIKEATEL